VSQPQRAVGSRVRTYSGGKDDGGGLEHPDSREWVFGLLATPRYRRRMEQLEALDLRRRTGCEPCLRALVTDQWTPDALHHLGWCDSCRAATIALGMHAPAAADASFLRRRAGWLAVGAFLVVAVPLVGSQVVNQGSQVGVRGGGAVDIQPSTTGTADTTTPGTTTPSTTPETTTPRTTTPITPVPRSKQTTSPSKTSQRGHKALPLTT
jgi:hypothetical protein